MRFWCYTKYMVTEKRDSLQYKGVIFDLDGTLVNSLEDLARSANEMLESFGFPSYDIESYRYRVGNGVRKLVERSLPKGEEGRIEEGFRRFTAIYERRSKDHTAPYDGIIPLLQALKERQILVAVCTNKLEEAAQEISCHLFGDYPFTVVLGDVPQRRRKPFPDGALLIARQWQLKEEEILFVGDSDVDMETATRAHMVAVGVTWGFRKEEELVRKGANYILHHPLELLDVLDEK